MKNQCAAEQSLKKLLRALRAPSFVFTASAGAYRHRGGCFLLFRIHCSSSDVDHKAKKNSRSKQLYRFLEKGKKLFLLIA
jgi:hypothetical protein